MPSPARRDFLKVAGAGTVAAGAVVAAGSGAADAAPALPKGRTSAITAHVADVRSGKVLVMVEGHEITITDKALVAKLAHAAQAARQVTTHSL